MVKYGKDEQDLIIIAGITRIKHELKYSKKNGKELWNYIKNIIELFSKPIDSTTLRESLLLFQRDEFYSIGNEQNKIREEMFRKLGYWRDGTTLLEDHKKREAEKEVKLKQEAKIKEMRVKRITIIDKITSELSGSL